MKGRKTHYDPPRMRTPYDDGDEYVFCGTSLIEGDFTGKEGMVTCKRCLNLLESERSRNAKEIEGRQAELYVEVWSLARKMGYMNVTDAIMKAGPAGDLYKKKE